MPETLKGFESAIKIHDKQYVLWSQTIRKANAEKYFIDLRRAIKNEYINQGYCELVDAFMFKSYFQIDIVTLAALESSTSGSSYNEGQSERIPGFDNLTWKEAARRPVVFNVDAVFRKIYDVNRRGRQLHLDTLKERAVLSDKTSNMLEKTHIEIKEKIETAEKEAKVIIADAEKKAKEIIDSAVSKACSSSINSDAAADRRAKEISEDLVKKYLLEFQHEYKSKSEKEITDIVDKGLKTLSKTEELHDRMCEETNAVQVSWMNALASATDELNKIKEDFYRHLHGWQVSLYPHEYEPLAERYIELYRILNVENMISEEIWYEWYNDKEGQKSKSVAPWNQKVSSDVIEGLQKLNRTMNIFLHKYEVSLNGLGLYVYRAEKGNPFDYVWHTNIDDSIDCEGKTVKKCIVPGVAKRVIGDGEDDVIIPALVSV